jgi:carnitine monooxygenase subunit
MLPDIGRERSAVEDGYTLATDFYVTPEVLSLERSAIFANTWQYGMHESVIPEPGTFAVTQAGEYEVIITRGRDGAIHAMRNVCAHRGSPIARGRGRRRTLLCPYHGWAYNLDGSLRNAPACRDDPRVQAGNIRLQPVRAEVFHSLIFINLAPTGPGLAEYLRPLATAIPYDWTGLRLADKREYRVRCNWKVAVENGLECYHCPIAHPSFRELFDVYQYAWHWDGACAISGAATNTGASTPYSRAEYTGQPEPESGDFYSVWPNLQLEVYPGPPNLQVVRWLPDGVDFTVCVREYYFGDNFDGSAREKYIGFMDAVYREDIALCEGVYANMSLRAFERGIVHRGGGGMTEDSLRHFHCLELHALADEIEQMADGAGRRLAAGVGPT